MSLAWQDVLEHYRSQHFQVFTREQFSSFSLEALISGILTSSATRKFLQGLLQPHTSFWDVLFAAAQTANKGFNEQSTFVPMRQLLNHAKQVAVLYGEHFAWKSPDKWSYLFEVLNGNESNYIIVHPPATNEQIQQAEAVLGISLPPKYIQFLQLTNGLGIAIDEIQFVCGVGDARAVWDYEKTFQAGTFISDEYHEIASYWFRWQDVLAYERQRDRETGINTFLSDEKVCIPFAHVVDDWCFDRSHSNERGEYPILYWDHEFRETTNVYPDFEAWFLDIVLHRHI